MSNTDNLPTKEQFKKKAKELRVNNPEIKTHGEALNALAVSYGHKNWKTLSPLLTDSKNNTLGNTAIELDFTFKKEKVGKTIDYEDLDVDGKLKTYLLNVYLNDEHIAKMSYFEISTQKTFIDEAELAVSDMRLFRRVFFNSKKIIKKRNKKKISSAWDEALSSENANYIFTHIDFNHPKVCVLEKIEILSPFLSRLGDESQILEVENCMINGLMEEEKRTQNVFIFPVPLVTDISSLTKTLKEKDTFTVNDNYDISGCTLIKTSKFMEYSWQTIKNEYQLTEDEILKCVTEVKDQPNEDIKIFIGDNPLMSGNTIEDSLSTIFYTDDSMLLTAIRSAKNNECPLIEMGCRLAEKEYLSVDISHIWEEDLELLDRVLQSAKEVMLVDEFKNSEAIDKIERAISTLQYAVDMDAAETLSELLDPHNIA